MKRPLNTIEALIEWMWAFPPTPENNPMREKVLDGLRELNALVARQEAIHGNPPRGEPPPERRSA